MTRPKGWTTDADEYTTERPSCTVYETDNAPIRTGVLDRDGNELFRRIVRNPIGFRIK